MLTLRQFHALPVQLQVIQLRVALNLRESLHACAHATG